jgi:hypothetical protein
MPASSMSTATLRPSAQQQRAASAQNPRQLLTPTTSRSSSNPNPTRQGSNAPSIRQEEKNFVVANYEVAAGQEPLPPEQIAQDPQNKQLGVSAQQLRVDDFELMKTLGTGMLEPWAQAEPGLSLDIIVDQAVHRHLRACLAGTSGKSEARRP